jgi:hypothetical protein
MIATNTPAGTPVRTVLGATGVTKGAPVMTSSGYLVNVTYDAAHAYLSAGGGADYRTDELEIIAQDAPAADQDADDEAQVAEGTCPNCGTELEEADGDDDADETYGWACPFCKAEWA